MRAWVGLSSVLGTASLALVVGCGSDDDEETPAIKASAYYDGPESSALGAATNQAKCSTCHSDDESSTGFSGSTFENIAYHESFKGGSADLLGGVNACVAGWMGGTELTEASDAFKGLKAFMESISDPSDTTPNPLEPEVLANLDAYETEYPGGDPAAGESKYAQACGTCHASGLVVGQAPAPGMAVLAAATAGTIARKVRTSGPPPHEAGATDDATPGPMPFFEPRDLSSSDLNDIIAYVRN